MFNKVFILSLVSDIVKNLSNVNLQISGQICFYIGDRKSHISSLFNHQLYSYTETTRTYSYKTVYTKFKKHREIMLVKQHPNKQTYRDTS